MRVFNRVLVLLFAHDCKLEILLDYAMPLDAYQHLLYSEILLNANLLQTGRYYRPTAACGTDFTCHFTFL